MIVAYQYRLMEPPAQTVDLAAVQMRAAHAYRNVLVEIERERRARYRQVMAGHPDTAPLAARVVDLAAQLDAVRREISLARAAARARTEDQVHRERARALASELRAARAELKEAKRAIATDPEIREAVEASEQHARQRIRDERARCGVYWGTYLLQEAAADQARRAQTDPEFRPWRGEGRVSVQLQGGLDLSELWGGDTQIWIDPLLAGAHDPATRRGDRRRMARSVLHLRVGSSGRAPVWAVWPIVMHRPLPDGSRIKVGTVSRRRRDCARWDWQLQLTVDVPDGARRPAPEGGAVALNLGYCQRPGGIRAGYLVGTDGLEREVLVPASVLSRFERSERIRGHRDEHMNAARAALCAYLAEQSELPAWLAERTVGLAVWRSAARLAELALEWRARRCAERGGGPGRLRVVDEPQIGRDGKTRTAPVVTGPGGEQVSASLRQVRDDHDRRLTLELRRISTELGPEDRARAVDQLDAGYERLEAWRYRDEHLQRMEAGLARGAALHRREIYRVVAAEMARRYRTLVVDDTDLREFQRSPAPESEEVELRVVKHRQRQAAGSELRGAHGNAFGKQRTSVQSSVDVTRRHQECGSMQQWDWRSSERTRACTECGRSYDQDANACRNLLVAWRASLACAAPADPARPGDGGAGGDAPDAETQSRWSARQSRLRRRRASGESPTEISRSTPPPGDRETRR